jgi:hypothetical protein
MASQQFYWLDPTLNQTRSLALQQAAARRTARRNAGQPDMVEQIEKDFLSPWDLTLLQRDISAYNDVQKNTPAAPTPTGTYLVAGALVVFGLILAYRS